MLLAAVISKEVAKAPAAAMACGALPVEMLVMGSSKSLGSAHRSSTIYAMACGGRKRRPKGMRESLNPP